MEDGPYCLFDDLNFVYLFQHCVHFIGCVNVLEENDKETGQNLTSKSLFILREACHECLNIFNELNEEWDSLNDKKLNARIIQIVYLMNRFNDLIAQNIGQLDEAAKNESLPDIVHRLEQMIRVLITLREKINDELYDDSLDNNVKPDLKHQSSTEKNAFQKPPSKNFEYFLIQFNSLYKKFQNSVGFLKQEDPKEESFELSKIKKGPDK